MTSTTLPDVPDRRVYLVSYPRSGQHFLERLIRRVTGKDDYCTLYGCRVKDCPGRGRPLAEKSPCPAGRHIQKTHDFDGAFPRDATSRYVVIIRDPVPAIMSWYELDTRTATRVLDPRPMRTPRFDDSPDLWHRLAVDRARYWSTFVLKWLTDPAENVRCFHYERLVSDPKTVKDLFGFAFGHRYPIRVDHHLRELKQQANDRGGLRDASAFRYDPEEANRLILDAIDPRALALAGYAPAR
jgi:hypothetical protein